MKRESDKELDDYFKNAMQPQDEHITYREEDWERMEEMLDGSGKRPVIFWVRAFSGVAAVLLVAAFIWWLIPAPKQAGEKQAVNHVQKPKGRLQQGNEGTQSKSNHFGGDVIAGPTKGATTQGIGREKAYPGPASISSLDTASKGNMLAVGGTNTSTTQPAVTTKPVIDTVSAGNNVIAAVAAPDHREQEQATKPAESSVKNEPVKGLKGRPVFALSIVGSPNVNGVGSFGDAKVGANAGVLMTVKLGNKWTVSTGAMYAYAPYNTSFKNYHTRYQFNVNPDNVFADCRVLDIPLNVDYRVYSKQRNSISIGTGLSSWFMLNEKYTFSYPGDYGGPASYSVSNQNRHIFGVLNLQATYQRQLNSKVGVMVQPFIKMPLTDIGYSEVRLKTAGIAAGITWNISP